MSVNRIYYRLRTIGMTLTFLPLVAISQDKGIHFEQGLSWQQLLEKARTENKYIFVDGYTTWCGPCKMMSTQIFPLKEVGNFMNERFISVGVQLDSTVNDNDTAKAWYPVAHALMIAFRIQSFPTYLFFSPDGHIVHRAGGASLDPGGFIAKAKDALAPPTQYYTLLEAYRQGGRDSAMLRQLALEAQGIGDEDTTRLIALTYLVSVKDLFQQG